MSAARKQLVLDFTRVRPVRARERQPCALCDWCAVIVVGRVPLCTRHVSPHARMTSVQRALAGLRRRASL